MKTRSKLASIALAAAALMGCAGLPVAEVEVPAPLASAAVQRLPAAYARSGSFRLDGPMPVQGRFSRSADRLSLFEAVDVDRAALTLDLSGSAGSYSYRCALRRTGAQASVVARKAVPHCTAIPRACMALATWPRASSSKPGRICAPR